MARISKSELVDLTKSDAVLRYIVEHSIPLTRTRYRSLAYMDNPPDPLWVEQEAALPEFLQNWRVRHAE